MTTRASRMATLIGSTAVIMWGFLALLTTLTEPVPPFQLTAMTFLIATMLIAVKWTINVQHPLYYLRQPARLWLLGVAGLFGYHFFYFMALRNAPPVEAGLIAYLWPLLIVLFSSLLPGERLRWWHVLGALAGLAGAALLITGGEGQSFKQQYGIGYVFAVVCALTWSSYSVLSRRFGHVPTDVVGGFCAATFLMSTICHFIFETTVWPLHMMQWIGVFGLGLAPVGLAFYAWDYGVKHGNILLLGVFSYFAPLISTLVLIAFGKAEMTSVIVLACLLIVAGALIAACDLLFAELKKQR